MKKKLLLLLVLLLFLMLPVSAAACDTGKSHMSAPAEMSFNIPARHRAQVVKTLLGNPQYDWPWKYINDSVHYYYGFYTSMGCDDVICRDLSHTHWCPKDICQEPSHGHSVTEYAAAASCEPTCACHKH